MKKNDLRTYFSKTKKEIEKELFKTHLDFLKVKVDMASGKEKNLKKAKNLNKKIAQLNTLLKYKNIKEEVPDSSESK